MLNEEGNFMSHTLGVMYEDLQAMAGCHFTAQDTRTFLSGL